MSTALVIPGPLAPGDAVDLGDGEPWTVVKLELRGGAAAPRRWRRQTWALLTRDGGRQTWALLTRDGGRRWTLVQEPEAAEVDEASPGTLPL